MFKNNTSEMVSMKNHRKVSCSTPEHRADSPTRDSDSDAGSPVPFLCTQDGAEGETDVVWNFYTPKSDHTAKSRFKNSTPVSRRSKRSVKSKLIEKQLPKRRAVKVPQKKTELFQELLELNKNLHELISKKVQDNCTDKNKTGSEDDIFNDSPECSPKSRLRSNSQCLRRNVLSSNFVKNDSDAAFDSDDSMNECLIKASQMVEENMKTESTVKLLQNEPRPNNRTIKSDYNFKMDQDSMDAIIKSIKLETPLINNVKKYNSPKLNNDSFDSLIGNLNDSELDKLTQAPVEIEILNCEKNNTSKDDGWSIKELLAHENSPSNKCIFGRHSSMPESPTVMNSNKPSTSGMVFGRYSSMPFGKDPEVLPETGDSPIRCTPDEIKKKHQLAREKLMAKRLLPFTITQKPSQMVQSTQASQVTEKQVTQQVTVPQRQVTIPQNKVTQQVAASQKQVIIPQKQINQQVAVPQRQVTQQISVPPKQVNQQVPQTQITQPAAFPDRHNKLSTAPKQKDTVASKKFQPRMPSTVLSTQNKPIDNSLPKSNSNTLDLKSIIEKKRQEALMKLRRRQIQSKIN